MSDSNRDVLVKALGEIRRLKAENARLSADGAGGRPVAVIGFACRMPGQGDTPEAFWKLMRDGLCAVTEVPEYRWPVNAYYSPDPEAPGKLRCRYGSFLGPVDGFDCRFFGISPKEAACMDPQQRLLLELAWEAIEDANLPADDLRGSRTGVFVGQSGFDFAVQHLAGPGVPEITPYVGTGCALSPAAGRISYVFDFKGPAYVVDTACSSSLVALHNACVSLRAGESDLALAGSANLVLDPGMSINFDKAGLLAIDGVVRTFDAKAHGFVRAEGGGMVVLKRLADARRDGDRIDGVILGSAVNQDGASTSLMAPNGTAQRDVLRAALKAAGVNPADVDVVEAHGTATGLGDPVELNAISDVYCSHPRKQPLLVGSLKTNFGHMEAAAGVAGLIKLLLSLRNEQLPPHLNFENGHPDIDWAAVPMRVCGNAREWKRGGKRRIAGLSGFGFCGTNAHIILAEPETPAAADVSTMDGPVLFVASAASDTSLRSLAEACSVAAIPSPAGVSVTVRRRRTAHACRLACVAANEDDLRAKLLAFSRAGKARGVAAGHAGAHGTSPVAAFVFCGHGAQYVGMGGVMYDSEPVFHRALDEALEAARPHLDIDLLPLFRSSTVAARTDGSVLDWGADAGPLDRTVNAQTAIFCIQYALAMQWEAWGIHPRAVLGHSLGEYTAACVAGVFSLADALRLIATRALLMEKHSAPGAMICAFGEEAVVRQLAACMDDAGVAAVNGPGIVLVSGAAESVSRLQARLEESGIRTTAVPVSHAFHSSLVTPILPMYRRALETVRFSTPRIPVISNVTGREAGDGIANPDYWLRHLREPVQFCAGMETLHRLCLDVLIEVSPEPVLMGLDMCYREMREATGSKAVWVPSLRKGHNDKVRMLDSLGRLFTLGHDLNRVELNGDADIRPARVPTYRFDRQRCWSAAAARAQIAPAAAPSSGLSTGSANGLGGRAAPVGVRRIMMEHVAIMEQYMNLVEADSTCIPGKPGKCNPGSES